MPKFKGSCGCYNRQDARDLGLATAIVWNDLLDRSEHFDENPMWYDQNDAAERLGMDRRAVNRAITKLNTIGRIEKKIGYRPGSSVTTTWVTIKEDVSILEVPKRASRKYQNEHPILKDTNNNDTKKEESTFSFDEREGGPASAGGTVGALDTFVKEVLEMAGFNATPAKIREATPAAKKALNGGVTKEEIYQAAKGVKLVKEGKAGEGLTPSIRSPFQRTDFWAGQFPAEKPKGAW